MSISSTVTRVNAVGNNAVSVYAYPFKLFKNTDVRVRIIDPTGLIIYSLVLNVDYTVDGIGQRNGGNITLLNASQAWLTSGNLTTGYKFLARRVVPQTQLTDIKNQGAYFPQLHEDEFDMLTMMVQELQDQSNRSVKLNEVYTSTDFNPQFPASAIGNPGAPLVVGSDGKSLTTGIVLGVITAGAIYDAVVGVEAGCNYGTLAAALSAASAGWRILVRDSATIASGFTVALSGILIDFAPGVTYTKGSLTGALFTIAGTGVRIRGGRFSGFDTAVAISSGAQYNFITECRFASCTVEVTQADASPNNSIQGNISE